MWKYWTSLARFISRYFISFEVVVNGSVSMIFLICLFNRKAIDFWMWVVYSARLLNWFITSRSFLEEFLASPMYNVMSFESREFGLFVCYLYTLISFFSLSAPASTLSTMLKRMQREDVPVCSLQWDASSFSLFRMILFVIHIFYYVGAYPRQTSIF